MEHSRIKKIGLIVHFSDLGYAIIENPTQLPKIGSNVVTETMEHIGNVHDIFGSVKKPYVSVKIKEQYKEKIQVNTTLYALDRRTKSVRQKRQYPKTSNKNVQKRNK